MTRPSKPQPAEPHPQDEHPEVSSRNAHWGLWLFGLYLIAYAAFIGLAASAPQMMGDATLLGPNVAIVYGFGLIFGAVLLALVYMWICKRNADLFEQRGGGR